MSRSLCRNPGKSCGDAYQRERQSRFTPSLKPIGLTFCPINYLFVFFFRLLLLARVFAVDVDLSVISPAVACFLESFVSCSRFAFFVSRVSIELSSLSTIRISLVGFKLRLPLPRVLSVIRFRVGP